MNMETTYIQTDIKHVRRFLDACDGNWHHCIHVTCPSCKTSGICRESGFLFHPDATAEPLILPLSDARILFSCYPEPEECIMLDPATAYQKLTGIYDEEVTEDVVYKQLIDTIIDEMHEHYKNQSSHQKFKYVDTPLVEAIRHGYLVEIQEPTVIANPGVLVGLNSLLDRCNSVFLPNGEVIKRHPDTTIVVTTNNDYAGCKQMNQSVISRMNLVIDLEEPDEETLVQRVLGITGCTDKKTVRTMAQIIKAVSEYCSENLITDGYSGTSTTDSVTEKP